MLENVAFLFVSATQILLYILWKPTFQKLIQVILSPTMDKYNNSFTRRIIKIVRYQHKKRPIFVTTYAKRENWISEFSTYKVSWIWNVGVSILKILSKIWVAEKYWNSAFSDRLGYQPFHSVVITEFYSRNYLTKIP